MPSESTFTPAEPRRTPRSRDVAPANEAPTTGNESTEPSEPTSSVDESTTDVPEPTTAPTDAWSEPEPTPPADAVEFAPSPRLGVKVGVRSTRRAFATGDRTTAVEYVQRALANRGYDVGAIDAQAGPRTRRALAKLREDAGFEPTVEPDRRTLELLGFDVVGGDD